MAVYAQEPNIESTTIADAAGVNIATVSAAGALKIDGSAVTQPVSLTAEYQTVKLYSATMSKTAIGVTELMALFVKNPNASGKTLYLQTLGVTNNHTVAGSWIRWRLYSNPTSSANGASITIGDLGVGSGNTTVATAFNTPTVSANGTLLADVTVLAGATVQYQFPAGSFVLANNTLLFTAVADATSRVGQVTLVWSEA